MLIAASKLSGYPYDCVGNHKVTITDVKKDGTSVISTIEVEITDKDVEASYKPVYC